MKFTGDAWIIEHEQNAGPTYGLTYELRNNYSDEIWADEKVLGKWVGRMTLADLLEFERMADGDDRERRKLLDTKYAHCKVVNKRLS